MARQEYIQPFDNQNIRPVNLDILPGHDIIHKMRINRRFNVPLPRLHIRQEPDQRHRVIAFGEPLTAHQTLRFQLRIREQKPVRRDELNLRRIRPAREQRLENAGRCRFPRAHRARQPDHIGHLAIRFREQKPLRRLEQSLCRRNIKR